MSRIRTNLITNRMANGAPTVSNGLVISGVTTSTTFSGSGASLTNIPSAQLTGALPALDGSNLTGITQTTINSNADNRVITGSGTANTLNAETNVVIDSTGRLLVGTGHSASRNVGDLTAKIQLEGAGYAQSSLSLMSNAGASAGNTPHLTLGKSRGSSNGSNTIIADDDALGQIQFAGADGTDCNSVAATIIGRVDGTPGSNDMPGRLVFSTTDDGAAAPTERVQIKSGGGLVSSKGGSLPFSDGYSALEARAPAGTTQLTVTNTTYESGSFDNEAGIWFKGNYSGNNERAKSAIIHKNTGDYGVGDLYFCIDDSGDNNNASVNDVKMKITKNGQVTQPSQPSFSAHRSSNNWDVSNGSVLPWDQTRHNTGGHFNTSNYRFTAPVGGTYEFSFYSIYYTNLASSNGAVAMRVNGSVPGQGTRCHFTKTNSNWDHVSYSVKISLNANDYIDMVSDGGQTIRYHGGQWSSFTGQLLS